MLQCPMFLGEVGSMHHRESSVSRAHALQLYGEGLIQPGLRDFAQISYTLTT